MKLFVLCLFFGFCGLISAQESENSPLIIIDGDSVNIDVFDFLDVAQHHQEQMSNNTLLRMRIAGIDTPEWNQTCEKNIGVSISCGDLATRHLQSLMSNTAGRLLVKPLGIDYYERILIRLYKGEINIGKQMVLGGMAYSYGDIYLKEETLARSEKRGFWAFAKPPINPKQWRKNSNK